jgi:hypothetical protein
VQIKRLSGLGRLGSATPLLFPQLDKLMIEYRGSDTVDIQEELREPCEALLKFREAQGCSLEVIYE